ncbi:MAG: proton-conducting transporter membrane subunit [Pseudomonadota bacterium]
MSGPVEAWTLAAPLLTPFGAAAVSLMGPRLGWRPGYVALGGCVLHLMFAILLAEAVWREGVLAAGMGGWAAPVGIALVADALSALMVVAVSGLGLACAAYALADAGRRREEGGFFALFQVLLAGATGAFLTGDLFNLYVWFEVMLIASFGLLALGGGRQELDGAVKYVALNLVATITFLAAIGLIHALAGTLTLAELPDRLAGAPPGALAAASFLIFISLAAKAGLFPLFFWLPAAYHAPPMAVTAIFAAVLTKAGIYALIRLFTLVFPDGPAQDVLMPVAIATMVFGVIGAAAQKEVHRILSFHIISQIGYVALGLALATPLALAGAIVYLVHNIIVKANLILIAGVARRLTGSFDLGRSGGLYAATPLLSFLFIVSALAMAGIPPFTGFWGKLALTRASLAEEAWIAAFAILGVGLFTLYSMTKIWGQGWLKPHPSGRARPLSSLPAASAAALTAPVAMLTLVTVAIGVAPEPLLTVAERAAEQLLDPAAYKAAVLGGAEAPRAATADAAAAGGPS